MEGVQLYKKHVSLESSCSFKNRKSKNSNNLGIKETATVLTDVMSHLGKAKLYELNSKIVETVTSNYIPQSEHRELGQYRC